MESALRFRGHDMALKPKIFKHINPVLIIPILMIVILHVVVLQFLLLILMSIILISDIAGMTPAQLWRMLLRKRCKNRQVVICRISAHCRYKNLVEKGLVYVS